MSDETSPDAAEGTAPPTAKGPAGRRTSKKLSTTGGIKQGPSEDEQRKFRKKLLIWIIVAIVALAAANGIKFAMRYFIKPSEKFDPAAKLEGIMKTAKDAQQKITEIEAKTWISGDTIAAADYRTLKDEGSKIQGCAEDLMGTMEFIRGKVGEDNKEFKEMLLAQYQIKLWVFDVCEVIDAENQKGAEPGFYIPMNLGINRWKKAKEELDAIKADKDALLADPEKKKATYQKMEKICSTLSEFVERASTLDDAARKAAGDENLSAKELPDLGSLREESTLAGQVQKDARGLRGDFKD